MTVDDGQLTALGRMIRPREMTPAASLVLGLDSAAATGRTLHVDAEQEVADHRALSVRLHELDPA